MAKPWKTPIVATGRRSLELVSVTYEAAGIVVRVLDETEKEWRIRFSSTQGLRVTTFESAFEALNGILGDGGLFEFERSRWLRSLGLGQREYMDSSRHFVVCCYDQVVEVAAWGASFEEGTDRETAS